MSSNLRWDDYRDEDLIWARLAGYRGRVRRAQQIVRTWLSQCRLPYISVSGGKDSVAMLQLIQSEAAAVGLELLPVLWHDSGAELPGVDEVFRRLEARGLIGELHVVHPDREVLDVKAAQVRGEISAAQKDEWLLFEPIRRHVSGRFDAVALGLRSGEAAPRARSRAAHGLIYRTGDGLLRCTPLGDWSWRDVYAYIAVNELPLHPIYSAPLHHLEDRGRIRLSWWCSTDHHRHGELTWLKLVYPELYSRLLAAIPEARRLPA